MKILAIMPTVPGRKTTRKAVDSLLRQGVDLRVYLNGFEDVPEGWPEEIDYRVWPKKRGPAIRYSEAAEGYDFVCLVDDDLVYPSDYVTSTLEHLERFGTKAVITWHGSFWPDGGETFAKRQLVSCAAQTPLYWHVPYTGSGVLNMRAQLFNAIAGPVPSVFEFEDDVWISSRLAARGIQIYRPPSVGNWIRLAQPAPADTLWDRALADGFKERNAAMQAALEDCPQWDLHNWNRFEAPP